ncbi:uncharacterized protein LOC124133892 [Haliotis rufescens]|uniref:uncharacterized protein LOC124133892 n=1 Tax=Haliotis rufescens TaxID=6454 RepID=UPI00201E8A29|nr:uncharacterized protein LOC124133892 [Haliotis rufescens]
MDPEIVGEEVDKTTDVVKKNNAYSEIRKRQLQKLGKPNGCGNTTRKNMRVNSGMHFSTYVGTPYHKLKKWFTQRRNKGRHCVEQGSSDTKKQEGELETTQNELTVRKLPGLPLLPMFPTTTQQTTQTVRQTTLNWKMQTITQQTHTKPLCWPPAYQAGLVSHASLLPSLSRILVDHLKENPHLLTPVHPAKRRRVEHEVSDCDAVVLDKVKTWLMTQTTDNVNDCENDDPSRDNYDMSVLDTSVDKRKRHASDDVLDLSCPKRLESPTSSIPDDVSVMFNSYQNISRLSFDSEKSKEIVVTKAYKHGDENGRPNDAMSENENCHNTESIGCPALRNIQGKQAYIPPSVRNYL